MCIVRILRLISTFLAILTAAFTSENFIVSAQAAIQCGAVVKADITSPTDTHTYTIALQSGGTIHVLIRPIGDYLSPLFSVRGPGGFWSGDVVNPPDFPSGTLSAPGSYTIPVWTL